MTSSYSNMWLYLHEIFLILGVHYVADFSLQTHWQATNKSSNNYALFKHVLTYSTALALVFGAFYGFKQALLFAAVNGVVHFATDYLTSRLNTHLWKKGDTHCFFVSVGADQVLHYVALLYTFGIFFK